MKIITPLLLTMSLSATATNSPIEPLMVSIPAGTFLMGSERGHKNEQPVREVQISPFMLGKYEVTISEFKQFIAATDYSMSQTCIHEAGQNWFLRPASTSQKNQQGANNMELAITAGSWDKNSISDNEFEPVVCIGWDAAQAYTAWLKEETGKPYRLPTEAEWEYSHRAGSTSTYSFGEPDDIEKVCRSANIADKYGEEVAAKLFNAGYGGRPEVCNDKSGLVSIVGLYQPNAFGLYDMLGNVEEWVQDCYVDDYAQAPVNGKSVEINNCKQRVLRGGSWHYLTYSASQRTGREAQDFIGVLEGFRLALDGDTNLTSTSSKHF
jgi:formylglycine-generating enzyme required for sulfatase activity